MGALALAPTPVVTDACVGCGGCIAACETGALDDARSADATLAASLDPAWLRAGVAVFGCARSDAPAGSVPLACLGRVTVGLLLETLLVNATKIVLISGDCSSCELCPAVARLEPILAFGRSLASFARNDATISHETGFPAYLTPLVAEVPQRRSGPKLDRRGFFRALRGGVVTAALAAAPSVASEPGSPGSCPSRRERVLTLLGRVGALPDNGFPLPSRCQVGEVEISAGCIGCNVCETVCPTGVFRYEADQGRFRLTIESARCVECGSCRDACLVGAIEVRSAERLRPGMTQDLAHTGLSCEQCGRFIATGALCRFCLASGGGRLRGSTSAPVSAPAWRGR